MLTWRQSIVLLEQISRKAGVLIRLIKILKIFRISLSDTCSIGNIYMQMFVMKWPSSLPVCIRLHFNGHPSLLNANRIIEWTHLIWLVPFFERKICVQNKHKGNKTKTKLVKSKMLKTLNTNQLWASWPSGFI